MRRIVVALSLAMALATSGETGFRWRIDAVNEILRPEHPDSAALGGIIWISNSVYWAVTDWHPVVWEMDFASDPVTGKLSGCRMKPLLKPEGVQDVEALARDPLDGSLWFVDEREGAILRCDPATGRPTGAAELPPIMEEFYRDSGLESLAIGADGLEMWTCAEETLRPDGPRSSQKRSNDIRLTKLVRASGKAPWKLAGQWVYRTDPVAGGPWYRKSGANYDLSRSGISELCLTDDGTLLVLEREFSKVVLPRFRCRIYEARIGSATDVSKVPSVADVDKLVRVEKRLLHESVGFSMYEGMCIGPKLADGSRLMLLVSDADGKTFQSVQALRLSPAGSSRPHCGKTGTLLNR